MNEADDAPDSTTRQQAATHKLVDENHPGAELVKNFRKIWCKSIDKSVRSKNDLKGVKAGDLCLGSGDLIIEIR